MHGRAEVIKITSMNKVKNVFLNFSYHRFLGIYYFYLIISAVKLKYLFGINNYFVNALRTLL